MLAEVIPLHSSASHRGFTYSIPEELAHGVRTGSLVSVPWRAAEDEGIVSAVSEHVPEGFDLSAIRPISALLTARPLLSAAEVETAHAVSARRFVPIHRAIGLFVPSPVVARARRADWDVPAPRVREPSTETGTLSFCRDTTSFVEALRESLRPGTLALFADDAAMRYWLARARPADLDLHVLPEQAYRTRRATIFREFREARHSAVATVRRGIFLPLDGFDRILAVEE